MPAVTISALRKEYPKIVALKGINLEIEEGEFFGLLGQNGAGKTTTINILTGLGNKTSGEVKLFDKDVVTDYEEARRLIGLVPQEFNLAFWETVYNTLFFNAGFFGIPRKERPVLIEKLLKELGLWKKREARVIELSGGMKRKLMIARALLHQPKILVLDEPTAGVDVETRKGLWEYFSKLNKQGTTILLTTHYLEEAEELCERIAIIHKGEIIALDTTKNLLKKFGQETIIITLKKRPEKIPRILEKYAPLIDQKKIIIPFKDTSFNALLADFHNAQLDIENLEMHRPNLEDISRQVTR